MGDSLIERLGFAPGERVAVVHADDIGMCHAANEGAFEALANGPASAGSIMVPCPGFREAAGIARANPDFDLGVHLVLNSEFERYRWGPVAGRDAVPSLLDDEGFLPRTVAETLQRARPEEVEIELRAQIRMALDAGIDVTHLDGHMGTVFVPPLHQVYKKLALEFDLPAFAARPSDASLEEMGLPPMGAILRGFADEMAALGYPVFDAFEANSLDFAAGEGEAHNEKRLAGLPPGLSYLVCHPARGGEELSAITRESDHQRDFEHRFYGGAAGAEALERHGIRTVGMRPLRDLLREGSA